MNNFKEKSAANSKLSCSVVGCDNKRRGISRYCRKHTNAQARTGDPLGVNIRVRDNPEEDKLVARFLDLNKNKSGIILTEELIDSWLTLAAEGMNVPGGQHIINLFQNQVSPRDIIKTAGVIYLLSHSTKYPQLHKPKGLWIAIGHNVLLLAPTKVTTQGDRVKRHIPNTKDKRDIGQMLMTRIGELFVAMKIRLDEYQETQDKRQQAIRANEFEMDIHDDTPHTNNLNTGNT